MSDTGPLLGKKIGNYVVTSLLGCGGMGEVYLAEHPQIGRKVAIKVLASHLLTTAQLASRFLAEAKAVARIDHPNVIDIYDFGSLDDGRLYYVMELLQGHELRHLLDERGKLSAAEVLPYLEQICAGLQAAHDRGIIHRDLKPENVFILDRRPLALKLLDFGIAKLLEVEQGSGLTSVGMVMGTPLFIAPEQALGMPERITARTDLYSLGVLLFVMLAGRPPFMSEASAILLAMHIRDAPPALRELEPSVAPEVAALVERCLEKDPLRRPASAAELARAFAAAVGTLPDATTLAPQLVPAPSQVLPAVGQHTTFSSSVGELATAAQDIDDLPRTRLLKWIAAGLGTLAVAGGIVFALLRGSGPGSLPDRHAPPAAASVTLAAARSRAAGAHAPDATAPLKKRHQILVEAKDPHVSCHVWLGERQLPLLSDPCRFEAQAGQRVRLQVTRRGFRPFFEEWTADADRQIAIDVRQAGRRLARVGDTTPPAGRHVASRRPRVATVPVRPHVAPVAKPPVAKPPSAAPPSAPPPSPTPPAAASKVKPRVIGEGTMEMTE